MEIPLLKEIVVILLLSIGVLFLCYQLKIPSVIGLITAGIFCGPHGLRLIAQAEEVEILARVYVIFLLFTIGMEFSISKLKNLKKPFFIGGSLQVGLTMFIGFLVGQLLGRPLGESLFLGCLLSLSSTAIVLKALSDQNETTTPEGKVTLSILIFQDFMVVLMLFALPTFAGSIEISTASLYPVLKGFLAILLVYYLALKVTPKIFYYVAQTKSHEIFLLTVIGICFSVTYVAFTAGLPLSLGAFLAGLILADSEYRHKAVGDILPLQDIFSTLFFISIGMLLDLKFILTEWALISLVVIGLIFMKSTVAAFATAMLGMPLRVVAIVGISLAQIGEFSFVLAKNGMDYGIGSEFYYQLFLATSIVTMILTPFLLELAPSIAKLLCKLPFPIAFKHGFRKLPGDKEIPYQDHIVIIGYGIVGRKIAEACVSANMPYVILDINPDIVRNYRKLGEPIFFGDATHELVLKHVNIDKARSVAIVTSDYSSSHRILENIHRMKPEIPVYVRTHHQKNAQKLYSQGASDVIVEETQAAKTLIEKMI